jgi:hypothetical protein
MQQVKEKTAERCSAVKIIFSRADQRPFSEFCSHIPTTNDATVRPAKNRTETANMDMVQRIFAQI